MFETAVRRMRARTGGTYVLFIKCAYLRGGYVRTSKNRQKSARAVCERSLSGSAVTGLFVVCVTADQEYVPRYLTPDKTV